MATYDFRDYWTDFDLLTKAIIRRLLQANDEFGNPRMRKAVLDNVNELRRFSADRFVKLGVLNESDAIQIHNELSPVPYRESDKPRSGAGTRQSIGG